jgi:hypothetical protein
MQQSAVIPRWTGLQWALGMILAIIASSFIYSTYCDFQYKAAHVADWTAAIGTVAYIVEHTEQTKNATYKTYTITYTYEVGGKKYQSNRYNLISDKSVTTFGLQVGSPIHLFYNPADPSKSVLDKSHP